MGTLYLKAGGTKSKFKLKIDFVSRREFPIRETVQTGLRSWRNCVYCWCFNDRSARKQFFVLHSLPTMGPPIQANPAVRVSIREVSNPRRCFPFRTISMERHSIFTVYPQSNNSGHPSQQPQYNPSGLVVKPVFLAYPLSYTHYAFFSLQTRR